VIGVMPKGFALSPFGHSTKKTLEIPDFLLSTMASGSTRLTVASLYSLPLTRAFAATNALIQASAVARSHFC
jgi:hypothetical protein